MAPLDTQPGGRHLPTRLTSVVLALGLAACGGSDGPSTAPTPSVPTPPSGVTISPETRVVDSTSARLVSDSSERVVGTYRFVVAPGAPTPFAPGNLLVGAQGDGFLRRASAVARRGDTVVVQTGPASLDEVIKEGSVAVRIPLDPAAATTGAARSAPSRSTAAAAGAGCASFSGATLVLTDCVLYEAPGTRVRLSTGSVGFDTEADVGADFGLTGLKEFHTILIGSLKGSLNVTATLAEALSITRADTLVTYSKRRVVFVGEVPVVVNMRVAFVAELDGSAATSSSVSAGVEQTMTVNTGVRYEDANWDGVFDVSTDFTRYGPEAESSTTLNVRVTVRPVVEVSFYQAVSATVGAELTPYLDYGAWLNGVTRERGDTLAAGVDAAFGVEVSILTKTVKDYSRSFTGPRKVLFARSSADSVEPVTPLAGKIAFTQKDEAFEGDESISVLNPDGTGLMTIKTAASPGLGLGQAPSWSPDGSRLAFFRWKSPTGSGLYVMNWDGSGEIRLTDAGFSLAGSFPAWSPDGSKIAFVAVTSTDNEAYVFVVNADGTGAIRLTPARSPDPTACSFCSFFPSTPSWSPDSRALVFEAGSQQIWRVNVDATGLALVSRSTTYFKSPAWSPDGSKILFLRDQCGDIGAAPTPSLWVMSADGSGERPLISRPCSQSVDTGITSPNWSPDGRNIVYVQDRRLYVAAADGSNPVQITSAGGDVVAATWGRGGR